MRIESGCVAGVALVLAGGIAFGAEPGPPTRQPLDMPGLQLPPGAGFEVLGTPDRISLPDPAALAALASDDEVTVDDSADWLAFAPRGTVRGGFILYPGAECDVRGYAVPLRALAARGYRAIAVRMPRSLAMLGTNRAADVIRAYPDTRHWAISGHSMGGLAAAVFATQHPDSVERLVLWDAYISRPADLSRSPVRVLLIHRADANGEAPATFARMAGLVPPDMERVGIMGASHMQFGNFIAAPHRKDPPASIAVEQQQSLIVAATIRFLEGESGTSRK